MFSSSDVYWMGYDGGISSWEVGRDSSKSIALVDESEDQERYSEGFSGDMSRK